ADIFFNNSINNGMLLISLSAANIDFLFNRCKQGPQQWQIDLANQEILLGNNAAIGFSIDADIKQRLLSGLDFIGASETFSPQIDAYEAKRRASQPWLG
ncbi:MAG: 3-isopropylmalate dehydratase small subunit, partial [Rheinheimera sp.]